MSYTVVYSDVALEQLRQIEKALAQRVVRCVDELEMDPYPVGVESVEDPFVSNEGGTAAEDAFYRIRCEGYRVVFEVDESAGVVVVWVIMPPLSEEELLGVLKQIGDEAVAKIVGPLAEGLSGLLKR